MRLINHLPNPTYFVYFGLLSFCASVLLLPTLMIDPVMWHRAFWSPDGSKLAIIAGIDNRDSEILVVDSNGANLRQLITLSPEFFGFLRWSEDSQTIYYSDPFPPIDAERRKIDLQSHPYSFSLIGNNAVNFNENPITTQAEIDVSVCQVPNL